VKEQRNLQKVESSDVDSARIVLMRKLPKRKKNQGQFLIDVTIIIAMGVK
jgi:hypothetical protein